MKLIVKRARRGRGRRGRGRGDGYLGTCNLSVTKVLLPLQQLNRLFRLCTFLPHNSGISDSTNRITRSLMALFVKRERGAASFVATVANWFRVFLLLADLMGGILPALPVWIRTSPVVTPGAPQQTDSFFHRFKNPVL